MDTSVSFRKTTIVYGSIPEQLLVSTRYSPSSEEPPARVSVQVTRLRCAGLTDLLQPLLAPPKTYVGGFSSQLRSRLT